MIDTLAVGDARRLAEACDAGRYGVIAVAGGDGTINEVVNGLARRCDTAPPLAIVPLGTANVLAYELGIDSRAVTTSCPTSILYVAEQHVGQSYVRYQHRVS